MNFPLGKPFPALKSEIHRFRSALLIGAFVFLFLYVFKPFGLSNVKGSLPLVTGLYGLITFICLIITQVMAPKVFTGFYDETNWTVGKEMFQSMANILLIAMGNFLLSAYLEFFPWSRNTFLLFIGFTLAVGIIPVTVQVLLRQNHYHRKNAQAVEKDNRLISQKQSRTQSAQQVLIRGEDGKIGFEGPADEVLAIGSSGNYVEVYGPRPKSILVRNSLSTVSEELPGFFFRTHRSWVVNMEKISHVDGNARGYVVKFKDSQTEVPVSRSNLKAFDQALRNAVV